MSSPATTAVVKEAVSSFQTPHGLPLFLSAVWVGVQTAAVQIFRRSAPETSPTPTSRSEPREFDRPSPGRGPGSAPPPPEFVANYTRTLQSALDQHDWGDVLFLVETLRRCWRENRQVFLCGNGGSAANAIHLANDFLYGIDKPDGHGLRVTALPANAAVLTCLANDIAYEDVFAQQLTVLAQPGDLLLAFSGSGNSPNILKALSRARELGVKSFAVLGFSGGCALQLADHPIYFPVHDMQVSEDLQMMVGHMAMQSLSSVGR